MSTTGSGLKLDVLEYAARCDYCTATAVFELSGRDDGTDDGTGLDGEIGFCRVCMQSLVKQLEDLLERAQIRKTILEPASNMEHGRRGYHHGDS